MEDAEPSCSLDEEDEADEKPWRASRSPEGWLAAMVLPGECSEEDLGNIWDCVVDTDVSLPGDWDTSGTGVFMAARQGDWAISAYLAARCFRDAGADLFEASLEGAHAALWLWVVNPIVLDVPAGCERLSLQVEGWPEPRWVPTDLISSDQEGLHVSDGGVWRKATCAENSVQECAEHFKVGKVLGLSRLTWPGPKVKCLELSKVEVLKLRSLVAGCSVDILAETPEFLREKVKLTSVFQGGSFQVLAYPLGGDFTKALLRPVEKSWQKQWRSAASEIIASNGDCLVAHFAKARKWCLVERLLCAGVPCPDLREEFADVCGNHAAVRRDWLRDLHKPLPKQMSGNGCVAKQMTSHSRSLFELALKEPFETLQGILGRLKEEDRLPDLNDPPLIVAAATAARWDVVKMLLELELSVAPLLQSRAFENAPMECKEFVHLLDAQGARPMCLKEYFERELAGANMSSGSQLTPNGYAREDAFVLQGPGGASILDRGVRLGAMGNCLAFVSVSEGELEACARALEDEELMLPIDLRGDQVPRQALLSDPKCAGQYVAVLCQASFLRSAHMSDGTGRLQLNMPKKTGNFVPNPMIPQPTVRVVVKTPCCQKPLKDVIVHVNGRYAGVSDAIGELRLVLAPGQHTLSVPYHSFEAQHQLVNVGSSTAREQRVELQVNGAFYFFFQTVGDKTAVKLTTNRYKVPPMEAVPFTGEAGLAGSRMTVSKGKSFTPLFFLEPAVSCAEQLPCQVSPDHSGYEHAFETDAWAGDMQEQGECSFALLFEQGGQQPMTVGYLPCIIAPAASPRLRRSASGVSSSAASPPSSPCRVDVIIPSCVSAAVQRPATAPPLPKGNERQVPQRSASASTLERQQNFQQDVAVRLVEVLKRTLDSRLGDIKDRLQSVESDQLHLEDRLYDSFKGRRRPPKSSGRRALPAPRVARRGNSLGYS